MHISSVRLRNYASYADTGEIALSTGINLIIGANNSGKSAFLQALCPPLVDNRKKGPSDPSLPASSVVDLTISISINEIFDRMDAAGIAVSFPNQSPVTPERERKLPKLLAEPDAPLELLATRIPNSGTHARDGSSIVSLKDASQQLVTQIRREDGKFNLLGRSGGVDNLPSFLDHPTSGNLFYFGSQRVNIGRVAISDETTLKSDASNLPTVLMNISATKPATFERIEQHLAEIITGIQRITIVPSGGTFEIFLWTVRTGVSSDVSFSLNNSGSGIAQLLAIISAIVLQEQSVIIIDEINTYLHPAAIKKLFRIIQSHYLHHQYIISCHSPDVIFSSGASNLLAVSRDELTSTIETISIKTAEDARVVAGLLGFSMLDVFGNERVIWVEGPTEEIVFPQILESFGDPIPPEIGVCAVGTTNGFSASATRRDEIIAIYENAGKKMAPLLHGMAFGLDREGLSDEAVKRLEASKRKLRFLPRRCVENYLLVPSAICQRLRDLGENPELDAITAEIERVTKNREYCAHGPARGLCFSNDWLRWVDGAKLLDHLFRVFSEDRHTYRKTTDTPRLVQILLSSEPALLAELHSFAANLLRIASKDSKP